MKTVFKVICIVLICALLVSGLVLVFNNVDGNWNLIESRNRKIDKGDKLEGYLLRVKYLDDLTKDDFNQLIKGVKKNNISTSDQTGIEYTIIDFEVNSVLVSDEKQIKLYYYNTNGWDNVYCYAFSDSSNYPAAWPGTQMTAVEGRAGWYSVLIDNSYPNVIFNNNDDNMKTGDLVIDTNKTYYNNGWTDGFGDPITFDNLPCYSIKAYSLNNGSKYIVLGESLEKGVCLWKLEDNTVYGPSDLLSEAKYSDELVIKFDKAQIVNSVKNNKVLIDYVGGIFA